jgi:hypothetical protein
LFYSDQEIFMKSSIGTLLASFAFAVVVLFAPSPVAAAGVFDPPVTTQVVETFGGISYVQYSGIFRGQTSTGTYAVPYQITAPADPSRGNRSVLVEPPHCGEGLGVRDLFLRRDFLFSRGFAHAGIGWSTAGHIDCGPTPYYRILDPTMPGVFINGGFVDEGGGQTDDEIITDFARSLTIDTNARQMLGDVNRRYITGFSDSSAPVVRLVTSGRASGVFDLAMPFLANLLDPQAAIKAGLYRGKLIIVNSELEGASTNYVDRGVALNQYRFYAVAGTPHVSDLLVPYFTNETTPASYQPALRAHFLEGDSWVRGGKEPPESTHLKTSDGMTVDRDGNGNAITVNAKGKNVPRLPILELGEARFVTGFTGSYDNVKTSTALGFKSHDEYLKAFQKKVADYMNAGYMIQEDANAMLSRAALCAPLTYTETYRKYYDNFTAITPCNAQAVPANVQAAAEAEMQAGLSEQKNAATIYLPIINR